MEMAWREPEQFARPPAALLDTEAEAGGAVSACIRQGPQGAGDWEKPGGQELSLGPGSGVWECVQGCSSNYSAHDREA